MSSVIVSSGLTSGSGEVGTKRPKESNDAMNPNKKERVDESEDVSSGKVLTSCTDNGGINPSNDDPDVSSLIVQSSIQPDPDETDDQVFSSLIVQSSIQPDPDETDDQVFGTFPLADEPVRKKPDTWVKKFKHAVLLSYSGSGYHGLQRLTDQMLCHP